MILVMVSEVNMLSVIINIIKLDSDITKFFPDSKSVNEALRTLIRLIDNGQNSLRIGV